MKKFFIILLMTVLAFSACSDLGGGSEGSGTEGGGGSGGGGTGGGGTGGTSYIADYRVAKPSVLEAIPAEYINQAGNTAVVEYFHTSHGTHVSYGVWGLPDFKTGYDTRFAVTDSLAGRDGKLVFMDHYGETPYGLKEPDLSQIDSADGWDQWVTDMSAFLEDSANSASNAVTTVMWSWCDIADHDVDKYCQSMDGLIKKYGEGGSHVGSGSGKRENPVNFIFMTGHANQDDNLGEGKSASQAQKIIDFCREKHYFCLDYYSIDTHDMDDRYWDDASDNAESAKYKTAGGVTYNFNKDWIGTHTEGTDWYQNKEENGASACGAHTDQHLTSNRKAYAFWWILARQAGWDGGDSGSGDSGGGGGDGSPADPMPEDAKVIFLHHSTGKGIWDGGVKNSFDEQNAALGKSYSIEEKAYPSSSGYGWKNYPYDYWNIWVQHGDEAVYKKQDTLKTLVPAYDVIVWKHCYPVCQVQEDDGNPQISSDEKTTANYKMQYEALKEKMRSYPDTRFIVWTGAARVNGSPAQNERARDFFKWVRDEWDEKGDNIYLWDFWVLETGSEEAVNLKKEYAKGNNNSHPNTVFSQSAAPRFARRVIDVLEGHGDYKADGTESSLTGE